MDWRVGSGGSGLFGSGYGLMVETGTTGGRRMSPMKDDWLISVTDGVFCGCGLEMDDFDLTCLPLLGIMLFCDGLRL